MKLISNQKLKATKENRLKNDCPLQCNKRYCDVCQFRDNKSESIQVVTTNTPSPEVYGRDFYQELNTLIGVNPIDCQVY